MKTNNPMFLITYFSTNNFVLTQLQALGEQTVIYCDNETGYFLYFASLKRYNLMLLKNNGLTLVCVKIRDNVLTLR